MNDDGWLPKEQMDNRPWISPDGTETVANWQCQANCPVGLLDEQSGIRQSGMMHPSQIRKKSLGKGGYHGGFTTPPTMEGTYGDAGGSSRFYPQFASFIEALDWLVRLIGLEFIDDREGGTGGA
jgi:hypothetical protein